jgi:predicted RNase H-like HicB family nuclease
MMHYPVIVRAESDNRYVARPVGLPEMEVQAATRDAAVEAVRQKLRDMLAGAELVDVEISATRGHALLDFFGSSVDDPDWEEYQAELERIRREGNRDAE